MNNVLTIIGAAAVDDEFLATLFKDPIGTARRYGFQLDVFEPNALRDYGPGERQKTGTER